MENVSDPAPSYLTQQLSSLIRTGFEYANIMMGFCHTRRLSIFSISSLESGTKHEPVESPGNTELEGSASECLVAEGRRNDENLR